MHIVNLPNDEYSIYNRLICAKGENELRNIDCINKSCNNCSNWLDAIDKLYENCDISKDISWHQWDSVSYLNGKGNQCTRRTLVMKTESIENCIEALKLYILKPSRGITFVRHFFIATYQFRKNKDLKANLGAGEVIFVQAFSKNRDIIRSTPQ